MATEVGACNLGSVVVNVPELVTSAVPVASSPLMPPNSTIVEYECVGVMSFRHPPATNITVSVIKASFGS